MVNKAVREHCIAGANRVGNIISMEESLKHAAKALFLLHVCYIFHN